MSKQCKESFICLEVGGDFREEEVKRIAGGPRVSQESDRRKLKTVASKETEKYILYFILWIIIVISCTPICIVSYKLSGRYCFSLHLIHEEIAA